MDKQLSIIITNWNTASVTCNCLRSIQQYLKNIDYEIIVVDNASTDDSVVEIKKLCRLLKIKNFKLKINSKNFGFSKGNNIGAKQAGGQYLLFLNSDTKLINNSLVKMFKFIQTHSDVGLIGPKFLNPDLSPQASVFPPQTPLNAFRQFWLNQPSYSKYVPDKLSYPWAISGGAILIPHQLFVDIGGWDENYFFYYEDLELCRQVRCKNLKICYFPQAQLVHHHGLSGQHLVTDSDQWRRLIPGSIQYHGYLRHHFINFIIWSGQKWHSVFS